MTTNAELTAIQALGKHVNGNGTDKKRALTARHNGLQVYGHRKYSCFFAEAFFAVDVPPRNFTPGDSVA